MEGENSSGFKSVSCMKLPESFVVDKQETKRFFSQFGNIRRFILYPSRCECVVEYETTEGAQNALNAKVDFIIMPANQARQSPKNEYFLDPDVQAELNSMLPSTHKAPIKPQPAPPYENFIKNPPQNLFKTSKSFTTVKSKTEPLTVQTSNTDPRIVQQARIELEILCKKPARSPDEKFAILDARDKLYRLLTAKPADIKRSEVTKGTCTDMCPEKERLMREARLQVASFELDEFGQFIDATRAIKQYSRSSADQETPLPHELRPENVLKTTMTYMLHNIINLFDEEGTSMSDWFHFIWDRTRGIRKDITQQELCSPTSVELLEQCTRFHIHCSARLIEEDPNVFDRKINDENLTKSLQTLKYMYDDLKMKNVKCKNEAEFRAYVVLLNLNDPGNFLWEIKRLEKDILKSKEVRFALEVYFAVSLNNYVKFFLLLKDASYMNACIMLRYFTQIRLKAISIITRSYVSRRGQGVNITLSYLTEILAFEDDEGTTNFMTYHGATCDKEMDNVNIDARKFGNPEVPFPMERSLEMVESKLEASVAEAICGEELPDPECFINLIPHESFSENGFLKKESFYAEDQNGPLPVKDGVFKVPKESPPVSPVARNNFQQKSKLDQPDGNKNVFAKNVFDVPLGQAKPQISNIFGPSKQPEQSQNVFAKTQEPFGSKVFAKPGISPQKSSIFNAIPSQFRTSNPPQFGASGFGVKPDFSFNQVMQQSAAQKEQEEIRKRLALVEEQKKKLLEEEKIRKEKVAMEQQLKELEAKRKREEEEARKQAELKRIQNEEKRRQEILRMRMKKLDDDSEKIFDELVDEVVTSRVTNESKIAVKLFVELPSGFYDALEHDTVVEELFKIYNQELTCYINLTRDRYETLSKFFKNWRTLTEKQIEKRRKLSNIGCVSLNQSLEEHATSVYHPQQNAALSNMKQYLSGSPQNINLPNLDFYKQIDLFNDLKITIEMPEKFYWKMLLSVPMRNEENCPGFASFIKKWLMKTFNVKENEEIFFLEKRLMQSTTSMASICMRKVQGIESMNEKNEKGTNVIQNANSILFFCTTANMTKARKRLQQILNNLNHPVCVSVIVYKNLVEHDDEAAIAQHFDLKTESNVIDFEINLFYECHEKMKDLTEVVLESCTFLCESFANQLKTDDANIFDLEMQQIHDFFTSCLGNEMWQRIEVSCRDSSEFSKNLTTFNRTVQVYNECLNKLIEIIEKDFKNLPTMSSEFRKLLPQIEPKIPNNFEYFPSDWKSAGGQKAIVALLRDMKISTMDDDSFRCFTDFKYKLKDFLMANMKTNHEHVFDVVTGKVINGFYRMQLVSNDFSNEFISDTFEKLRWMDYFGDIVIGRFNEVFQRHRNLPPFVVYFKRDLRCYRVPWWYKIKFANPSDSSEPARKKRKTFESFDKSDFDALLKKGVECGKKVNDIIDKSKQTLSQTRVDSKSFDQYLSKCEEKFRAVNSSLSSSIINEKP